MVRNNCLICFSKTNDGNSLSSIFLPFKPICDKCLSSFQILKKQERFFGIDILYLYEYNAFFRQLLYQYKGCYDIELKDVFLYSFINYIKRKYRGYTIVFPPSSDEDNKKRGFKHIEELVKCLKMKTIDVFYKKVNYKQSSHFYSQRKDISQVIDINKKVKLTDTNYLIIDDVFTSGSTIKTIVKILVSKGIKKENIKAIILAKTKKEPN